MSSSDAVRLLVLAILLIGSSSFVWADVVTMTADTITVTRGVTNGANAYGTYDGLTAVTGTWSATGDLATMTMSNPSFTGTIINISFGIRMNTSGAWNNDNIAVQHTNDGATWVNIPGTVQPPATLTTYGPYNVTTSFTTLTQLNNAQVRLRYTRTAGTDNIISGIDGVEMYVTYAPPPAVSLSSPADSTWWTSPNVSLNYTPSTLISFTGCAAYINGLVNASNQTVVQNNQNNSINITNLADGTYTWNVTCTDTGGYSGTAAASRTLRVDTTPPDVSLAAPLNNHITGKNLNNFTFNVTDAANIVSCTLFLDDVERDSITAPTKSTNHNLSATIAIGDHTWYVNCTDENGWTGTSAARNISVQITTPTVITSSSEYAQGQTAIYSGSNWDVGATLLISTTLPNGTSMSETEVADAGRTFSHPFPIGYGYPTGTYSIFVTQANDTTLNATTTYTVTRRPVWLIFETSAIQGEAIPINGIGFSPSSTVNLTILFAGGRNTTMVTADIEGNFSHTHQLALDESLSQHNVTAIDLSFPNLNASGNFTVTARVARVRTNKSSYAANQTVGINGTYFPSLSTILVQIYRTVTERIAPGFPTAVSSDADGGFTYAWPTNHTCSGNYTVLAQDESSGAQANTTFLINNNLSMALTRVPDAVTGSPTPPTLSQVTLSDGTLYTMGLSGAAPTGYVEFTFSPSIPAHARFTAVNVSVEHRATSTKVDSFQFYLNNNSVLVPLTGAGCAGTPPIAEAIQTCDITAVIANSSMANNLAIRVAYSRTGGGGGDMEIDHAYASYSWSGDMLGCFNLGDADMLPVVSGVSVSPGVVVLNPGTTRRVECNFTVTDGNGAHQITGANVTLFTSPSTHSSIVSNVSKYENASCAQTGSGTNMRSYSCGIDLLYYAANGTWYCNATGITAAGSGSSVRSFTVDPLFALSVSDDILSFGELTGGETSGDVPETVMNYGNQRIDVSALGYGSTLGDGNSFNCETFNVSVGAMRFAPNNTASYAQKETLDASFKQLRLFVQRQTTPSLQQNTSYWQFQMPDGPYAFEQCNGTIVFQAEMG